ncbi:MAG: protein-L-isoaspartate(D-aspartate) O-methyltransferase [candidate division Zixibacteria bacterium]|nr:protein-L-isoaspartate(D-aspartate) O-methyltransferase [candidate division Zixibacteria bacterium]
MVETQIIPRGISDTAVLEALRRVPRHLFVPKDVRRQAYADHPLPIGENQTISQPYIVALMTELPRIDSTSRVLEIGTGSGYQAAILGELAGEVYTIEIVATLAERSSRLLDSLGYQNVHVRCGDGYAGWPEQAPFDAIIVTCAPPEIPQPLIEQLADGGRLVAPVGTFWQELILIEKANGELSRSSVIPVRFVPMTGEGVRSGKVKKP